MAAEPEIVTLKALSDLARRVIGKLEESSTGAVVLGLVGDLGTGKTTFVQALAKELGIVAVPRSPTFVLMQSYPLAARRWSKLIHFDAYRLDAPAELLKLGWVKLLADPQNLIVVEWADRVETIFPSHHHRLQFKHLDETRRQILWLKP